VPLPPVPVPRGGPPPDAHVDLTYPPHAGQIALFIWLLGFIVTLGWWHLRGEACVWCGKDVGACTHTKARDEE
jgi:hypothetical protein